jgi:hypothetical protein
MSLFMMYRIRLAMHSSYLFGFALRAADLAIGPAHGDHELAAVLEVPEESGKNPHTCPDFVTSKIGSEYGILEKSGDLHRICLHWVVRIADRIYS